MKLILALLSLAAVPAAAATPTFTVLGSAAGAVPEVKRSQPAALIKTDGAVILVDAGDGAAEQLAKAKLPLAAIDALFISHLHFDHIGGLFAVLGLRYQQRVPSPLTIYGPPGTAALIAGLVAAMQPSADVGAGIVGLPRRAPDAGLKVVELYDGDRVTVADVAVRAVANSHYSFPTGSDDAKRYQSLSFRFDAPARSIVYTGDTGPSPAVEALARDADLLISEIIDPEVAIGLVREANPAMPAPVLAMIRPHFTEQHLIATAVGELAQRAHVKKLVLTHNGLGQCGEAPAKRAIAAQFKGPVSFARDLDVF